MLISEIILECGQPNLVFALAQNDFDQHSKSVMHREAVEKEALLLQSRRDGGIVRSMEEWITA